MAQLHEAVNRLVEKFGRTVTFVSMDTQSIVFIEAEHMYEINLGPVYDAREIVSGYLTHNAKREATAHSVRIMGIMNGLARDDAGNFAAKAA